MKYTTSRYKYTISRYNGAFWVWCGDGDTDTGTMANLPDKVLEFADSGKTGEVEVDGVRYRVVSRV